MESPAHAPTVNRPAVVSVALIVPIQKPAGSLFFAIPLMSPTKWSKTIGIKMACNSGEF